MYINLGAFCADCPWGGLKKRSETGGVRRAYPPLVETLVVAVRCRAGLCTEGYVSTPESGLCLCGTRPVSPAMWGEWPKWRVRARPDGYRCRGNHGARDRKTTAAQERKRSAIRAAPYQGQCLRQPFRAERQPPPEPAGRTTQKFPPPRTRGGGTKGGGEPLSFAQRRTAAEQKN